MLAVELMYRICAEGKTGLFLTPPDLIESKDPEQARDAARLLGAAKNADVVVIDEFQLAAKVYQASNLMHYRHGHRKATVVTTNWIVSEKRGGAKSIEATQFENLSRLRDGLILALRSRDRRGKWN